MTTTLSVRGLSHWYGEGDERFQALADVSFDVAAGEIVALPGPHGAGETTTIRVVTGYFHPGAGTAFVEGHPAAPREARARTGYLPESAPLDPALTVEEHLAFWAEARDVSPGRIREVLETLDLVERAHDPIGTLSKGFRQRVGLAAATLHDPALVVLDEPTSALDPSQVRDAREMIRALGRRRAVLLSTHLLHEAEMIADRVVVIARGKIAADGPVKSIVEKTGAASLEEAFVRLVEADA